jgi:hypothetical protein
MNPLPHRRAVRHLLAAALSVPLLFATAPAAAAPGAHGPNGEHLDAPPTLRSAPAPSRIEAQSEAFELVAELRTGELVIVVDRFASNEPVLGARLEVESGALKAVAAFRAEPGDYVVTNSALLNALARPGEHAVVFTLVAGQDSDLLDGTLVTAARRGAAANDGHGHGGDDHGHEHDHTLERAAWAAAGVAALGLIGGIAWWRQRRRGADASKGGL